MTDPHTLAGAYALDALTPDEREEFVSHLAGCADCQQAIDEFGETLVEVSALTDVAPPPQVRANVLEAIKHVPQQGSGPVSAGDPGGQSGPPGVDMITDRVGDGVVVAGPRSWWRRATQIAVAAVVAVALAIGGWAVGRSQYGPAIQADDAATRRLLSAPDAKIYHQPMPGGARVTYVISQSSNSGMVIISGRPDAGPGRVFQLWTIHRGKDSKPAPRPDSTFTSASGDRVWFSTDVSTAFALAITNEPDGGSPQPTTDPLAFQRL